MTSERQNKSLRIIGFIACLGFVLVAPAESIAAKVVPPGNSEIDQYTETLPGAQGNEPTGEALAGNHRTSAGNKPALSPSTAQTLQRSGPAGRAVADLARATSPNTSQHNRSASGGTKSGLNTAVNSLNGSNSGGMGIVLPMILAAVTAVGLAYILRRRARLPG
jgi:cobalamin biosynthesis Mg chelatase CobN